MSIQETLEEAAAMVGLFGAVLNSKFKGKELDKIGSNPKAVKARRKRNKNKKTLRK